MNITTFDNDLLELRPFAERLQRFIDIERQFVDDSLVIALSSKFGSGKTTFFQMWKSDLENHQKNSKITMVISLNAWESDYYGDPLFAIISGLVDRLREFGDNAESIVGAVKDLGWFATAIGGQIVQKFTGIDAVSAGALTEEKKAKRDVFSKLPEDTFSAYRNRKDAMNNLKEAIQKHVSSSAPRVLFLVDELDRCRPDYAIAYLETIKHIFNVKGAVFILAADRKQLENSAKTAFGPELDFDEYYRKFIHREVSLPPISEKGYGSLAKTYIDHYLQRDGIRNCFMNLDWRGVENISELVGALKLTPRQIQEMFRILGHIFETSEQKQGRLRWCLAVGSLAMAAFKVGKLNVYHLLANQEFEPLEAFSLLSNLFQKNSRIDWWFKLFLTGGGLKVDKKEKLADILKKVGLIESETEFVDFVYLEKWREGWGDTSNNRFAEILEKIEQILQWE